MGGVLVGAVPFSTAVVALIAGDLLAVVRAVQLRQAEVMVGGVAALLLVLLPHSSE